MTDTISTAAGQRRPTRSTLVILSGGFDPLHEGHIAMFKDANRIGTVLVGVMPDQWLIDKKGYAALPIGTRLAVVESNQYVDMAFEAYPNPDGSVISFLINVANAFRVFYAGNIVFANGGDRLPDNTPEMMICESMGITTIHGLGGGKVNSSSELLKPMEFYTNSATTDNS